MKKNRMLRMASALLILTLLTTSVIGGTFAKYVSTGSVSDTARVAKWGVEIKTSGTLYSDAYAKAVEGDGSNLPVAWTTASPSADSITVAAAEAKQNIVAPGTKSHEHGLSFAISGTPEVAVKVKTTIKAEDIYLKAGTYGVLVPATTVDNKLSFEKLLNEHSATASGTTTYDVFVVTDTAITRITGVDDYNADNKDKYYILTNKVTFDNDYFPVVYTLGGTETGTSAKTAVAIADVLAEKIKTSTNPKTGSTSFKATYEGVTSDVYKANTNLATDGPKFGNEKLTWVWPIEDTEETNKVTTNAKDTLLGDLMAMRAAQAATPSGTVDYKIVQITAGTGGAANTIKELTVKTDTDDYTVTVDTTVVANLRTLFDIELTVEQVD